MIFFIIVQITDHLGNVRGVIKRIPGNPIAAMITFADYYPFGEKLPTRDNITGNYRYAYQGQELDGETGMEAFQLRLWDGRIGRWLNPDPYGQYDSPYLGMGNNPANRIDPDGGEDDWHYDDAGNLVADPGDNASTLAAFLCITLPEANSMFNANEFGSILKGGEILNTYGTYQLSDIAISVTGKKKETSSFDNFRSDLIKVSFDNGADKPVNPKLINYLSKVIEKATEKGIYSINISSTTNHSSNAKKSAHSFSNGARALDINWINGVHVSPSDPNSKILQKIIQSTPGWRENYGPSIIQKMNNGIAIQAPWARDIKGGHYDHVHVSVPH